MLATIYANKSFAVISSFANCGNLRNRVVYPFLKNSLNLIPHVPFMCLKAELGMSIHVHGL